MNLRWMGVLATAAVLVATGCAADDGVATTVATTVDTSSATTGPTGTGPTTSDPAGPQFDPDPQAVVIELRVNLYTLAGMGSRQTVSVYGDGRIVRTKDGGPFREELRIDSAGIQTLLADAAARGLTDPGPLDAPITTDSGAATLTLTIDGRQVVKELVGLTNPERSDSQGLRDFSEFTERLRSLQDIEIVQQPQLVQPEIITTRATPAPDVDAEQALAWPFDRPAADLFAEGDVLTFDGTATEPIIDLILDHQDIMELGPDLAVFQVATGSATVPVLRMEFAVDSPLQHDKELTPVQADPDDLPWPATDRRATTAWESWLARTALNEAADRHELPLGDSGYIRHYTYASLTGSTDDGLVIDVVATPVPEKSGRADIPPFTARVAVDDDAGVATVVKVEPADG